MKQRERSNWFDVKQLAPDLYGIGEFGHVEKVLSFLLIGNEQALLIDSGFGFFSMKQVVGSLTSFPCAVINTHSHFDHVGSNFEFEHIALYDHPLNRQTAAEGFDKEYLAKWIIPKQFHGAPPEGMTAPYEILSFPHAQFFKDGDIVHRAFPDLIAIHTPGHSDDSVSFFDNSKGWLFTGDLLYNGPIYIEKVGGLQKFRQSIEKILSLKGVQRIFGSHVEFEFSNAKLNALVSALRSIQTLELETAIQIDENLSLIPI